MSEINRAKVLMEKLMVIEKERLRRLLDLVDRLNAISKEAHSVYHGSGIARDIADVGAELLKVATEK